MKLYTADSTLLSSPIRSILSSYPQLARYSIVPIDQDRFAEYKSTAYSKHIQYGFGAKDSPSYLGTGIITYDDIDCSGFFETLLYYSTHNVLHDLSPPYTPLPDGSYLQADWFLSPINNFYHHRILSNQDYLDAVSPSSTTDHDPLVRACFHLPNGRNGDSTGHVWIDCHGHSVESYGGHGPGERPILHQWFQDHCDLVVIIGPLVPTSNWSYP